MFNRADHDADGHLNELELKYWMEKHNHPITHRDARHILHEVDLDHDGTLSFVEFLEFCIRVGLAGDPTINSIFACLEEDSVSIHNLEESKLVKKHSSHLHLQIDLQSTVQFFQHKVSFNVEPIILLRRFIVI